MYSPIPLREKFVPCLTEMLLAIAECFALRGVFLKHFSVWVVLVFSLEPNNSCPIFKFRYNRQGFP